jgi:hypothetical protein
MQLLSISVSLFKTSAYLGSDVIIRVILDIVISHCLAVSGRTCNWEWIILCRQSWLVWQRQAGTLHYTWSNLERGLLEYEGWVTASCSSNLKSFVKDDLNNYLYICQK